METQPLPVVKCLSRCLTLSCLVPWSSPCPGFDLPIQPPGVPLAGLPWPPGYSDCQRQGDASQRKGHTPNKAAGPPPFMQNKHSPPLVSSPPPPMGGGGGEENSMGQHSLEFLSPGSVGGRSPSASPFEPGDHPKSRGRLSN